METEVQYKTEIEGGIDLSYLATLMLDWERKKKHLGLLEQAIKDAVVQLGKTQTTGNVRATYSNPRKSYDYQAAADGHPAVTDATISLFTERKVDWRRLCKHAGIEPVVTPGEGPGSVSLKLLKR